MSALPSSLAINLKRFQSATTTSVRISGDRPSYISSGVLNFKLGQSGVLDLNSIALLGDLNYTSGTTATTTPYNACWIRRVEFVVGGQVVSLNQLQDFGFVYYMFKLYSQLKSKSDYQQTISQEGNLTIPATTAGSQPFMISDWLGIMGSPNDVSLLPLSLLPPVEINIMLHDSSRWTLASTTAVLSLTNVRLQFQRLDFADNLMENMWNNRLTNSVITIPFMNVSYAEGSAITSSSSTFTTYVNTQSLEYIFAGYRTSDYDTNYANRLVSHCGDTTSATLGDQALSSLSLNGTPLFNYQSAPIDSLWNISSAFGGSTNQLYSPDFGTATGTFTLYKSTYFLLGHRVGFPLHENDGASWASGLSTNGTSIPIDFYTVAQTSLAKKAFIITVSKSTMELGAGRQVALAL